MKTLEKSLLSGICLTLIFSFTCFKISCENISQKILRLHILANSNQDYDQSLKLKVRDKILSYSGDIFLNADNLAVAEEVSRQNLEKIEEIAAQEITQNGYNYPVKAELCNMHFNTRRYDDLTIPAGEYKALRLTIGEGQGNNWWCVMFPPLCLGTSTAEVEPEGDELIVEDSVKEGTALKKEKEKEKVEFEDVLNSKEINIISGEDKYQVKLKVVEYFESAKTFVKGVYNRVVKAIKVYFV